MLYSQAICPCNSLISPRRPSVFANSLPTVTLSSEGLALIHLTAHEKQVHKLVGIKQGRNVNSYP